MGTVTLLLGIHNHQPQGNFDHVFEQGYADCYLRMLEAIERHSEVRISMHYSGPLIEWIEDHHPDYFDRLRDHVESGRVELLGGGHYEPMLSVLPGRDAQGQLKMMSDFLSGRVGKRPRGMWLAERVWEPDLARVISRAGYRYTVVDDSHFLAAGMKRPLRGYFVTEKAGRNLCLFPISMELRYAIPFKPAQEAIDLLLKIADEAGDDDRVVTYGDDGEKFGMWPGTKKWVWDEGWLDTFFGLLAERSDRIRTATFSEVMRRQPPDGRVYLPTASYDEMGEWSLPAEAQRRFHDLHDRVEEEEMTEDWGPFVRGGIWQGFLAKYPESNFMHKRMCHVSDLVAKAAAQIVDGEDPARHKALSSATRELYRGQCNCAYWHGLFGGLYLAKLRSAVHSHLIRADRAARELLGETQSIELERLDLDGDLRDEVLLTGERLGLIVSPGRGGAALAIDDRRRAFCLTDVLTRRPEAYHAKVLELSKGDQEESDQGEPKSIHDIVTLKDEGLADDLIYDPHQRLAFVDQFFAADLDFEDLGRCCAVEAGDFVEAPYQLLEAAGGAGRLTMSRTGSVRRGEELVEVTLHKTVQLEAEEVTVGYEISPAVPLDSVLFASELSLALPSGPDPEGKFIIFSSDESNPHSVGAPGVEHDVYRVELVEPSGAAIAVLKPTPAATMVRFPIETVSQSESGIERTYQGSTVVFLWPVNLESSETFKPKVRLKHC